MVWGSGFTSTLGCCNKTQSISTQRQKVHPEQPLSNSGETLNGDLFVTPKRNFTTLT